MKLDQIKDNFKAYDSISKIEYGKKFSVFKMVVGE